jgi:NADH-ubiquinone oxidoreductase chain 5
MLNFITILGALTSFVASTTGLVQNDLKRVIAYSTCSQVSYMVFACGLSNYSVGIFHLSNHAFFKALLFLSAGSVIHCVNDEQDMRKLGGLKILLPFTYSMMMIGSLSLIGFPFLSGFYSKDLILETAYGTYNLIGYFSYFLGTFGAFLTAFYSTRLIYLTFLTKPTGHKHVILSISDSKTQICMALGNLALASIFIGYFTKDIVIGIGSHFFGTAIFTSITFYNVFDAEFLPLFYKNLPVHFSLSGVFLAFILYNFQAKFLYILKTSRIGRKLYNFLNRKWFFDKIYNEFLGQFFFKMGYSLSYKFVDRGIFEFLGPTGSSVLTMLIGSNLHKFHTGSIYHITLTILNGVTILLILRQLFLTVILTKIYWLDYNLLILIFVSFLFITNYSKPTHYF